jgi:hypothetical protein
MVQLLFKPENAIFAVALCLVLFVLVLELIGALVGAQLSELLGGGGGSGEFGGDGVDLDGSSAFGKLLAWLHVGRVPVLILALIFLAGFGLSGLLLQRIVEGMAGSTLNGVVAALPAALVAVVLVRTTGRGIARLLPKEETTAVSRDSFVGRVALIVLGSARKGAPAQAKLRDAYNQIHYVMVEPDVDGDAFSAGERVLIVGASGHVFRAIRSDNAAMTEDV